MGRYNRRLDGNHTEIKNALEKSGYKVWDCGSYGGGIPDLVVKSKSRIFVFIEVKMPKEPLTDKEQIFFDDFAAEAARHIARSAEEALGIMEHYDNQKSLQVFKLGDCINHSIG